MTMPTLFLGHGSPLNAIRENTWTRTWERLGRVLPRPRAILAVSAHWYIPGCAVTAMSAPRTIHDFGGFPPELYAARYAAPGDPVLARRVQQLLAPLPVALDEGWGLDHGSWAVLCHLYPQADVPVVQLSLDARAPPAFHYELGARLRPLRTEGVLILGSGDVVHNLRAYAWDEGTREPYDWAVRFEARVDCTQDMAGDIKVSQRDSLFRQWQEAKALRRSVDWLESRWICGIKDAMEDP